MAQYDVNHSCGHTHTISLFGKTKDRYSKIEWMETQDCPQCWGAKKRAEEALQPIAAKIYCNGLDTDRDGNLLVEIALTGGTINRKDEIKSMGYFFTEIRGGVFNFLSTSKPDMAWVKRVVAKDFIIKDNPVNHRIHAELTKLEVKLNFEIGPMDLAMIQNSVQKQKEESEKKETISKKIAEIRKPGRPACHPRAQHPNGRWNNTYYGGAKYGYNYYVDGVNYKLTKIEYDECMAYRAATEEYDKSALKIKEEN